MTDYVGGPEDNVFNLTHLDAPSTIDGGGGYDILNFEYTEQYSFNAIIDLYRDRIRINNSDYEYTKDIVFTNIERVTIKSAGGSGAVDRVVVHSDQIDALIDGSGEASLQFDFRRENEGRTLTYYQDTVSSVGQVKFQNIDILEVLFGSGNDVFSGDADAAGGRIAIYGGSGDDILDSGATSGLFDGGDGNDIIYARSNSSTFHGSDGDDIFYGLSGGSTLIGDYGNDLYFVEDSAVQIQEVYSPLEVDEVRTSLANYLLPDHVEYLTGTSAAGQALTGNRFNNRIVGNVGADTIAGGDGNDVIEGGAGNDILSGERGTDSVSYEHAAAGVQVSLQVSFGASFQVGTASGGAGDDQLHDFENILGSAFGDVLTGNEGYNTLNGFAGADILSGLGGGDVIDGGEGDDILSGGADTDVVSYEHAAGAVTVSLLDGVATGAAGNDTLSGFEDIIGSAYSDVLTGDDGNNVLWGLEGNNIMNGGKGNDFLSGGVGSDIIEGGEGDDQMYGSYNLPSGVSNYGIDTVSYEHAASAVTVALSQMGGLNNSGVASGGAGNDTLVGFENIRGSAYDDRLTGTNGANILSGLAGADRMTGLAGNDRYWVDNQGDVVVEAPGGGYDRVFAKVTYTLSDDVEELTLLGRGNIHAYGNEMDNLLIGNSGKNRLIGRGGEDMLIGGAGNDIYHVNSWGDRVVEAAGGGADLIVSSISVDLLAMPDVENVRLVGRSALNLNGNAQANVLEGNAGDNVIRGFGGADVLTGGAGADRFGFDAAPGAGNVVRITDFSVADDDMLLLQTAFGTIAPGPLSASAFVLGSVAGDADDRILYDGTSGALFYDADGSGEAAAVQFAALTQGLALTHADFLIF